MIKRMEGEEKGKDPPNFTYICESGSAMVVALAGHMSKEGGEIRRKCRDPYNETLDACIRK